MNPERLPNRQIVKEPELIVLPGLSAPIDQGPFFPKPPMTAWRMVRRVAIVLGFGALLVVAFLMRGLLFR